MAPHECFLEHQAGAIGGIERFHDLVRVARVRLLAQDVLAGCQGPQGPLVVERVGQADIDGIDRGIGQQVVIAAMRAGDTGVIRERARTLSGPATDRNHLQLVRLPGTAEQLRRDVTSPQETPPDTLRVGHGQLPGGLDAAGRIRFSPARSPASEKGPMLKARTIPCSSMK